LTAGHNLKKPGVWTLETNLVLADRTLHVPLKDIQFLAQIDLHDNELEDIDLAWARIPQEEIKEALSLLPKDQKHQVELPLYRGPLNEEPTRSSSYGFAAWNRTEFHPGISQLLSEASYEVYMCYAGTCTKDGLYEFRLARSHQGWKYYKGSSGAPIADEEGLIVAFVAGGDPDKDLIYGVPLARYHSILDLH